VKSCPYRFDLGRLSPLDYDYAIRLSKQSSSNCNRRQNDDIYYTSQPRTPKENMAEETNLEGGDAVVLRCWGGLVLGSNIHYTSSSK
jgi:hypothetical protein